MVDDSEAITSASTPDVSPEIIHNFYPATRRSFELKAGEVSGITAADFEDEHKRRHLESFQHSMSTWRDYERQLDGEIADVRVADCLRRLIAMAAESESGKEDGEGPGLNNRWLETSLTAIRRETKFTASKSQLGRTLKAMVARGDIPPQPALESVLIKRTVRTSSGVAVITVLTSPGKFSCPKDCHYCPNEPGQPRSYLSTEPAVLRANQCGWDPARQFWDRAETLMKNGHTVDKVELLVLGGTWSGYSVDYQKEFCRDLFYAANEFSNYVKYAAEEALVREASVRSPTIGSSHNVATSETALNGGNDIGYLCPIPKNMRARLTLEEEHALNESSNCKMIGLTLETRPDYININEIRRLRSYGCTRVQIGVQHTDEQILQKINRGCTTAQVGKALRLLKDACFKVDVHLMPDLPGSDVRKDEEMFDRMLQDVELQADQWKIYPCEVTPFSRIAEWYAAKTFEPYTEKAGGEESLLALILRVKKTVHPWIRLNRVVRDIPNQSIIAGNNKTNLRQILAVASQRMGWTCRCMRCREIRTQVRTEENAACLKIRRYDSGDAHEYFLSFESYDEKKLYGFLRLRLRPLESAHGRNGDVNDKSTSWRRKTPFECLKDPKVALLRELHVYGSLVGTTPNEADKASADKHQHIGFGRTLILAAETLAVLKGYDRMAIIAGVGTRNYYRKFGYGLEDTYMTKWLVQPSPETFVEGQKQKATGAPSEVPLDLLQKYEANTLLPQCMTIQVYELRKLPSVANARLDLQIMRDSLAGNNNAVKTAEENLTTKEDETEKEGLKAGRQSPKPKVVRKNLEDLDTHRKAIERSTHMQYLTVPRASDLIASAQAAEQAARAQGGALAVSEKLTILAQRFGEYCSSWTVDSGLKVGLGAITIAAISYAYYRRSSSTRPRTLSN